MKRDAIAEAVRDMRCHEGRLGIACCRRCGFIWETGVVGILFNRTCKCGSRDVEAVRVVGRCLTVFAEVLE